MSRLKVPPGAGFSLAEVIISILLVAIAVVSVFSIQLAIRAQGKKSTIHEDVARYNRLLQEELKNYVRPNNPIGLLTQGIPGNPAWHLPGDPCTDCTAHPPPSPQPPPPQLLGLGGSVC